MNATTQPDEPEEPALDPRQETPEAPALPSLSRRTVIQAVAGLGLAIAIIVFGLPYFADTTWERIGFHLDHIGWAAALELFALMAVGLWAYTFTLTGSLPGLGHLRALMMNVSGSAVGNLLPGGGAAGVAVSFLFGRSWGFTKAAITTSVIVSGVWNVLARIALPLLGVAVLAMDQTALTPAVRRAALASGVTGLVVLVAFIVILVSDSRARALGGFLDRHAGHHLARLRRGDNKGVRPDLTSTLGDLRARLAKVTATGWLPMTFGVTAFLGIYFILFWRTMEAVGVSMPLPQLFAAYAIGRLLTAVGVTPGGLGVTEAGTLSVMVAWGADPPAAAAGVLVFALYTHIFEVPLGLLGWLGWSLSPKVTPPD